MNRGVVKGTGLLSAYDLIELCIKKQNKKMMGVIAGAAIAGPVGAVAADVGGKIIDAVKKKNSNDLDKD